jgi:hypothetical protein
MPLIDLANPAGSQGLAQLAGPFGSNLGGNSFPSSYEFAKRFVNNAKTANGSGANAVTSLDDPTYLGFSLMFDISSPLFNGATIGANGIPPATSSPAPNDGQISTQGGIINTPSDSNNTYPASPSAVAYLNKIGEANRAEYLKAFIQGIQEVNQTRPYYFQTITGITEAWQKNTSFSIDPYTGTTAEEGITIGCLEAIDLKITALFNLYKMAVYDNRYKRYVVPKNLLKFDVYVYVQEIRKFKTVRNWLGALNPSDATADTKEFVNENTSQVGMRFMECMWDPAACGKVFEGVTNTGGAIASTEIKWSYGNMEDTSQYSGYNDKLDAGKTQGNNDPSFAGKLKQFGKDQLMNQVDGAVNLAGRFASSLIQGFTLGNVFGLRNNILGAISNPQALANAAAGAIIPGSDNALDTFGNDTSITNIGDNPLGAAADAAPFNTSKAFDPAVAVGEGLQSLDAFDPAIDVGTGLNSTNAFGPSGPPPNSTLSNNENIFE